MAQFFGTNGSDVRSGTVGHDTILGGPDGGDPLLELGNTRCADWTAMTALAAMTGCWAAMEMTRSTVATATTS